ncbi:MAG: helix-turn-helix domain-containing protein [Actinomycetota bacterium]|nr:helix-turn-helix domain-containing protein [Actinomycetota bacterium]
MTILELAQARAALPRPEQCRAIRRGAGLSLGDLAEALSTNPITVSRWERGARRPSKRFIVAYVGLLADLSRMSGSGLSS